jgi:hypothetical protein
MNKQLKVSYSKPHASLLAVLSVASVSPAFAYIDPGTGSMLVQMTVAAIAGALFYFRQLRTAATDWFRRVVLRRQPSAVAESSSDPLP